MIRVERGSPPALLDTPEFNRVAADYQEFHASGGTRASQTSLGGASSISAVADLAHGYVYDLFRGKCAYTEAIAVEVPHHFHLHRPEADAYDERLGSSAPHYWWLATWYGNWYLASNEVAGIKLINFPVLGSRSPEQHQAVRTDEDLGPDGLDGGLLLDPCRDRPEWHLAFLPDGRVEAWADRSPHWLGDDAHRGPTTIRLLDLNSRALVAARREAVSRSVSRVDPKHPLPPTVIDPGLAHIGAIRQVLALKWIDAGPDELAPGWEALAHELAPHVAFTPGLLSPDTRAMLAELIGDDPYVASVLGGRRTAAPETSGAEVDEDAQPATPPPAPPPARPGRATAKTFLVPRTAAISRVLIKNFQAIEYVDFAIPVGAVPLLVDDPDSPTLSGRSWKVLLGENGTGKSATLRAIGLALASTSLADLEPDWAGLLRAGTPSGRVRLDFTEGSRIDLRFTGTSGWYVGGTPTFDGFVRGFGATRPLGVDEAEAMDQHVRLDNLFDPGAPVVNAERWLLTIDDGDFNVAAVAIAEILGRSADVVHDTTTPTAPRFIERTDGTLTIAGEPLRHLSDGYQTMIATVCDLMAAAGTGLADMRNASGIVLMDELGTHLHPRWKMQVTSALRRTFPGLQFIVSTHEPLCLLGLVEREVTRVRQSSTRIGETWHATFEELEQSPSNFRVDRLLTSEFFGLDTTIDPVVEREFREYYALIRKPNLATVEDQRRRELRARLSQHGVLGYTARDQLVYEAIDQFLSGQGQLTPDQRKAQRTATLQKVVDIWQSVAERRQYGSSA